MLQLQNQHYYTCISNENVVNKCVRCLQNVSLKSFKGFKSGSETKSYGLWPLSMTLTLKPAIRNIASAHRLGLVNICVRFLRNLSRGSRVTEQKGNKVIWRLSMTFTLKPAIRNIAAARRLSLVNICVRFLRVEVVQELQSGREMDGRTDRLRAYNK